MNGNTKIIILSVVVIILALGTFYYLKTPTANLSPTAVTPSVQPVVQTGNTSDTQLNSDINTVDSNLKNLDSQNSQVDAGLNQTAVDPTK